MDIHSVSEGYRIEKSGLIEESLIVREYFLAWNMQTEFQSHEDGKLRREQIPPVEPEDRLRLLYHHLELVALAVVQLGRQNDAGPRTELPVHLIYDVFQDELFEVYISLGKK